ncbi:MAG: ribosome maturation factor RimP [Bacilli bacterium]|nr:ribosome maturation factor RimP [Bacilli bacterium]
MNDLEKIIFDACVKCVEEEQMQLLEVELVKEFGALILRFTIDKEGGIDIDDTTLISEKVSLILDEIDPIDKEYYLEVSSIGLERELRNIEEIKSSIGKYINVKTYEKLTVGKISQKEFEGTLLAVEDNMITMNFKVKQFRKEITIPYEKIAKIRLAIEF